MGTYGANRERECQQGRDKEPLYFKSWEAHLSCMLR